MRRLEAFLLLMALALSAEAAFAQGFGERGPCTARNAAEVYCVNHGGCPRDGNCYFPDGSYCGLKAFYNGTCPGKGYYEELTWQAEAYRFLHGDEGYYPYQQIGRWPIGYYGYNPGYYYRMPTGSGPYWSGPLSSYPYYA